MKRMCANVPLMIVLLLLASCGSEWQLGQIREKALSVERVTSADPGASQAILFIEAIRFLENKGKEWPFDVFRPVLVQSAAPYAFAHVQEGTDGQLLVTQSFSEDKPENDIKVVLTYPLHHLRPWLEAEAPFWDINGMVRPNDLLQWYFREVAGAVVSRRGSSKQTALVRECLAYYLHDEYIKSAGQASMTLTDDFRSWEADRMTLRTLLTSLDNALRAIETEKKGQADFLESRDRYLQQWKDNFFSNYNRFIVSDRAYFPAGQDTSLTELLWIVRHSTYATAFQGYKNHAWHDVMAAIKSWNSLGNDEKSVESWFIEQGI